MFSDGDAEPQWLPLGLLRPGADPRSARRGGCLWIGVMLTQIAVFGTDARVKLTC